MNDKKNNNNDNDNNNDDFDVNINNNKSNRIRCEHQQWPLEMIDFFKTALTLCRVIVFFLISPSASYN